MELNIDTGVEEFRVNGRGVLRFNPANPNLYHRFFAAGAELDGYDAALTKALAALDGDEQQRAAPEPLHGGCQPFRTRRNHLEAQAGLNVLFELFRITPEVREKIVKTALCEAVRRKQ